MSRSAELVDSILLIRAISAPWKNEIGITVVSAFEGTPPTSSLPPNSLGRSLYEWKSPSDGPGVFNLNFSRDISPPRNVRVSAN